MFLAIVSLLPRLWGLNNENKYYNSITLKAALVNKNMQQKDAARVLVIAVDTLSNWEKGKTFPNVPQIKKIEEVYGVSYSDLIFCSDNSV